MPWDVTQASGVKATFAVGGSARDLAFSADGAKLYIVNTVSGLVSQYPLSSAWDISTVGSVEATKLVSGEDATPLGVAFSSDGTKLYITGSTSNTVYQYPLSTAWDLSTAGATNASKSASGDSSNTNSVTFSADGLNMYVVDLGSATVFQYPLSTAWDLSTAGSSSASFSVSSEESSPCGLNFRVDGSVLYVVGFATDRVYQYPVGTAWDLSTTSATSGNYYIGAENASPQGIVFSPRGDRFFIAANIATDSIHEYWLPGEADPEIAWTQDPDRDPINIYPRIGRGTADPHSTAWPPLMRRPNKGTGMVIVSPLQSQLPQNQHEHAIKWLWGDIADPLSTYPRMAIGTVDPMSHRWAGGVNRPFRVALEAASVSSSALGSRILRSRILHSRAIGGAA